MIFWTVRYTNTQIQIHKYTNTQIQHMTKKCYILNSWGFKDVKNDNPTCSILRYTVDVQTFALSHQVYSSRISHVSFYLKVPCISPVFLLYFAGNDWLR